jgi:hypothetical protein
MSTGHFPIANRILKAKKTWRFGSKSHPTVDCGFIQT